MTKFLALNISISADGFIAGPNQSLEKPMGENGQDLHKWVFRTEAFSKWIGKSGGQTGIDNDFVARGFTNIGANIMGRNMFGPVRGEWKNSDWKGWWGDQPGFKNPVFVLTHFPRESIDIGNGTVFHFITEGIQKAYELAQSAAMGKNVRVGGGANTLQQFLAAGLLDEIHLAYSPIKLDSGEKLFTDPEEQLRLYKENSFIKTETVIHRSYIKSQ